MKKKTKLAADAGVTKTDVDAVLDAHRSTHGDFAECAKISQGLLRVLRQGSRWGDLKDYQVEALQMACHKFHRIVCGDPDFKDHWVDVGGYTQLVVRQLEKEGK